MRKRRLLVTLTVLAAANALAADAGLDDWAIVVGEPKNVREHPSLCFYTVITKRANSYVLTEGYAAVRFEPKGSRGVCEAGSRNFVDLASRQIFVPQPRYGAAPDNEERFKRKLDSTKAIALLEKAREDDIRESAKLEREAYLSSFERARDLPAIYEFETRYKDKDPDNLIPTLTGLKAELEYKQYKSRYAEATTSKQLSEFIVAYEANDPDSLVPAAYIRIPLLQKQEAAELEQKVHAQQKQQALAELERRLSWCNSQTEAARRTIDRERQIAAVSAYENKVALRQAGETIVFCREKVAQDFAEYKRQGGKKALADIR